MAQRKTETKLSKKEKDLLAAEGRKQRLAYMKRKEAVKELEANNREFLIFFRSFSTGKSEREWWKIGGASAVIYAYRVSKLLGRKVNLKEDTDDYFRMPEGSIAVIADMEGLKEKILQLRGYKLELEEDGIIVIKLPQKIEEPEFASWVNDKKQKLSRINQIVLVKHPMPDMENLARINQNLVYYAVRKMEVFARDTLGKEAMELSADIRKASMWIAHVDSQAMVSEYLKKARHLVKKEKFTIKMLVDLDLISGEAGLKIVENLVRLERHI